MQHTSPAEARPERREQHHRAEIDDTRLRRLIGYQLRRAEMVMQQRFSQAIGVPFGLRQTEFFALSLLAANPALTHKQISEAVAVAPSNMVGVMGELEERGLVGRCANRADGRSFFWRLSVAGGELVSRVEGAVARMEEQALEAAQPARDDLSRALDGLWSR